MTLHSFAVIKFIFNTRGETREGVDNKDIVAWREINFPFKGMYQ